MIVRLNGVGPALPVLFVAVMLTMLIAATFGVPVSAPAALSDDHAGRLVPLHVIGAVPLAVN